MSLKASYFLLRKDKFEDFCMRKGLVPKDSHSETLPLTESDGETQLGGVRLVTQREMKSKELRRILEEDRIFWKSFEPYIEVPFEFKKWGVVILSDVVACFKNLKNIDLTERTYLPEHSGFEWWVVDEEFKTRYLEKLNPSEFSQESLRDLYHESLKPLQAEIRGRIPEFKKLLTQKEFEEMFPNGEPRIVDDFPQRGEAMLDAVTFVYQYVEQVHEKNLFMLSLFH